MVLLSASHRSPPSAATMASSVARAFFWLAAASGSCARSGSSAAMITNRQASVLLACLPSPSPIQLDPPAAQLYKVRIPRNGSWVIFGSGCHLVRDRVCHPPPLLLRSSLED